MRTFLLVTFLLCAPVVSAFAQSQLDHPPQPPPKRGMTMAQVLARYGEPRYRARLDGAPIWYYRIKFNQVYGRELVPFEFSSENVYTGEIVFGPNGKITRYNWAASRTEL